MSLLTYNYSIIDMDIKALFAINVEIFWRLSHINVISLYILLLRIFGRGYNKRLSQYIESSSHIPIYNNFWS